MRWEVRNKEWRGREKGGKDRARENMTMASRRQEEGKVMEQEERKRG